MAAVRKLFLFLLYFLLPRSGSSQKKVKIAPIGAIREDIGKPKNIDLWSVGMFIAAHKYFGVDYRYQMGAAIKEDMVFYKQFPSQPLKDEDPTLAKVCGSSTLDCVHEIMAKAKESGSLQHIMTNRTRNNFLKPYAPFENNYDLFLYRQTAMNYLCWHTLMNDAFLSYADSAWGDNLGVSCLEHLTQVDEVKESKRWALMNNPKLKPRGRTGEQRKVGKPIVDDQRDQTFRKDDMICAHLWFCPDPCYGRKRQGNYTEKFYRSPGNPCAELPNKVCDWQPKANLNYRDLVKNKFNVSCKCTSHRDGFVWSNRFGFCVDKDECYDNEHNCPVNRICRNTVGSFMCTCAKGYDVNAKTDECEKVDVIHDAAVILEVKEEDRGSGLKGPSDNNAEAAVDDFMNMFGLSSAPTIRVSCVASLMAVFMGSMC